MINSARLLLAALAVTTFAACPAVVEVKPPEPAKPIIPAYEPTGEFAELKKGAAAGIDENTAAAKAAETEAALAAAIAKLEADAAAKKKKGSSVGSADLEQDGRRWRPFSFVIVVRSTTITKETFCPAGDLFPPRCARV